MALPYLLPSTGRTAVFKPSVRAAWPEMRALERACARECREYYEILNELDMEIRSARELWDLAMGVE